MTFSYLINFHMYNQLRILRININKIELHINEMILNLL
jgi:hypothetical protein